MILPFSPDITSDKGLVPTTRDQAALIADVLGNDDDLDPNQKTAFRQLYRLDDTRSIEQCVRDGDIYAVTDNDIYEFLIEIRKHGITNRAELDHRCTFLKAITDQGQVLVLKSELPKILKGYFLQHCMAMLDKVQP